MVSSTTMGEAVERLDEEHPSAILEFRERVRVLLGERLRDLRLYGSAARGTMHDESDIDVLVLIDGWTKEDRDRIWALAYEIYPVLFAWVDDYEHYHRPMNRATGFYQAMREESVRL